MKCGLRSQGEAACECDAHARHPNLSIPTPTFRSIAIKRNNGITTVQSALRRTEILLVYDDQSLLQHNDLNNGQRNQTLDTTNRLDFSDPKWIVHNQAEATRTFTVRADWLISPRGNTHSHWLVDQAYMATHG